jgi:hypothetical protein
MKDQQAEKNKGVPFFSPAAHYITMSVLVFLRRGLGLEFLKPRWLFLLTAWVYLFFFLFAVLSRDENSLWTRHWPFLVFVAAALVAYLLHLVATTKKEWDEVADPDYHSGESRLLPFAVQFEPSNIKRRKEIARLYLEPAAVLGGSLVAFGFLHSFLGKWLLLCAVALCLKEIINQWNHKRKKKQIEEGMHEINDLDEDGLYANVNRTTSRSTSSQAKGRTGPQQVRRRSASNSRQQDLKHAAVLGMEPPYSLQKAMLCYRESLKRAHPDPGRYADDPETVPDEEQLQEVIEAIRHFKKKYAAESPPDV